MLYEAREKLSWTPGTQRSLVMIGDAIPHPPSYPMNTMKLDWKVEAKKLNDECGVKIYAVQALNNSGSILLSPLPTFVSPSLSPSYPLTNFVSLTLFT